MNFVKLNAEGQPAEWPVTMDRIRFDNPRVSFPKNPAVCDFSSYGFGPFRFSDKPDFDSYLQNIEEIEPVLSDGVWVQSWSVTEKYSESERAEKIAEREAANLEAQKASERNKRDNLLKETDWVAIKAFETGIAVDEAMATYRQALRDIPQQEGFPNSINWPTKPE